MHPKCAVLISICFANLLLDVMVVSGCEYFAAMVAEFPRPNAFLSAIAYGSLEQVGFALEKQYPFLSDVIRYAYPLILLLRRPAGKQYLTSRTAGE